MRLPLLLAKMTYRKKSSFVQEIPIIALSVILALIMVKTKLLSELLLSTSGYKFLGSFIAGLFFTSVFTTAPAIVTLGQIAKNESILPVAFFGALGALVGDLIIFRFVRDRLSEHFTEIVKHERWWKRIYHLTFKLKYFRWVTFFIGGLIIASPFPDELGISLLGLSKMKTKHFLPLSLAFNFLGILVIGALAKSM